MSKPLHNSELCWKACSTVRRSAVLPSSKCDAPSVWILVDLCFRKIVARSPEHHLVPCRAGDAEKSASFSASIAICNEI